MGRLAWAFEVVFQSWLMAGVFFCINFWIFCLFSSFGLFLAAICNYLVGLRFRFPGISSTLVILMLRFAAISNTWVT